MGRLVSSSNAISCARSSLPLLLPLFFLSRLQLTFCLFATMARASASAIVPERNEQSECSDGRRGSLRPMSVNSAVSCSRDLRARLDGETCLPIQYYILRAFFSSSSLTLIFSFTIATNVSGLRRFGPHRRDKMCLNGTSECECNEGRRRSQRRLMSVGRGVSCCVWGALFLPFFKTFSLLLP